MECGRMSKKANARVFGQDIIKGEWHGNRAGRQAGMTNLTWVKGDRSHESLDDTSRKILAAGLHGQESTGTSIFDPVLCELAYRWFCPPNGLILDPFAGGSVRGIVAAKLGRKYVGIDLRPEQIAANQKQATAICDKIKPKWIVGDSLHAAKLAKAQYDFVFSCPPYGDLEVYSDNPADLSTMKWEAFCEAYRKIIAAAVGMLKPDRFACFVVGDFRDKAGFYRSFPALTADAFEKAGAKLYNDAILVTAVGSLPIRVAKQFTSGRKLGHTHQSVLVFCNGSPQKATAAIGDVEVGEIAEVFGGKAKLEGGHKTNGKPAKRKKQKA